MANSISFIHAADLHLDSPFKGLTTIPESIFPQISESTFHALDNLVKTAIMKQVDFVLLVGDLFDNENQSLKAQILLKKAFETLQSHNIQVYLSYGNHDYISGNIHPITYPENVSIFPNENITSFTFKKNNQKIASIYGFSYENRSVKANKSLEYTIQDKDIPFHIAMLHGTLHGNKDHDPYAPFNLGNLQEKPFDYWALGHIHKREELSYSPPIIYPGNIQGRHRKEAGEKGCYYVQLSKTGADVEFLPLQSIQFEERTIDVSACKTIYEIEEKMLTSLQSNSGKTLVHLTFFSEIDNIMTFETDGTLKDLIEIINETLTNEAPWSYIYTYRIQMDDVHKFHYDDFFVGEIIHSLHELSVTEIATDLYHHPLGRKFLDHLQEEDIKDKAKQFLIHELLKVKEGE